MDVLEIAECDLPEAARFIVEQSPREASAEARADVLLKRLRWLLLDNPARRANVPLGWLIRNAEGSVIGTKLCVPRAYAANRQRYTALMSAGYYVDAGHKGLGAYLFRKYLTMADRYALFATTANALSAAPYRRLGGYPIHGTDREYVLMLNWRPVVEEALWRKTKRSVLARPAAIMAGVPLSLLRAPRLPSSRGAALRPLGPEEFAGLDATSGADEGVLTSVRDLAVLQWRYLNFPGALPELLHYTSATVPQGCAVAVLPENRGYRGQIRALKIMDIIGHLDDTELPHLAAALAHRYRRQYDVLVWRSYSSAQDTILDGMKLVCHRLTVATGWCLDPKGLLPTKLWHLPMADRDSGT